MEAIVQPTAAIWKVLETVCDPEVPVLTIVDLGIVRDVQISEKGAVVTITPTYSGCPAMDVIRIQIKMALAEAGIKDVEIKQVLSPAWTTDWMSEEGKKKLEEYGIAPPQYKVKDDAMIEDTHPPCPQCKSADTRLVSEFGSTACKALFQCNDCLEPFDYFKCH